MAFKSRNISVLTYANSFSLWHYTTTDATAAILSPGYFDEAARMIHAGDMIMANVDTEGTPSGCQFLVTARTDETKYDARDGAVAVVLMLRAEQPVDVEA